MPRDDTPFHDERLTAAFRLALQAGTDGEALAALGGARRIIEGQGAKPGDLVTGVDHPKEERTSFIRFHRMVQRAWEEREKAQNTATLALRRVAVLEAAIYHIKRALVVLPSLDIKDYRMKASVDDAKAEFARVFGAFPDHPPPPAE